MPQVIFITVQISTDHPWLDAKMLQITEASQHQLSEGNYPVVIVKDYEEINHYLDKADWLFVETAGDVVINRDHLWNKIHSLTEDIGVMGHIIWYPEEVSPHLHDQCFIINTRAFPKGLNFKEYTSHSPQFVRGQGDMNCGHAPLSVYLAEKSIEQYLGFGASVMQDALEQGFKVVNFDESWRYPDNNVKFISIEDLVEDLGFDKERYRLPARGHFYPKINPGIFESALKTLTINEDLDESQTMIISIIKKGLDFNYLNVWHWDCHAPHIQADVVISPANGLLGESMALTSGAKKIIFFDLNPNNIEFKRSLYRDWNGENYQSFAESWAEQKNIAIEPLLDSAQQESQKYQGFNEKILSNWTHFKNLEVEFYNIDLLEEIDFVISKIDRAYIHTSTILNYFMISNVLHSKTKIQEARTKIMNRCRMHDSQWQEST
jgi:hypothetical protein